MNARAMPPRMRVASEEDLPAILDLIRQPDFNSVALDLRDAQAIWAKTASYPYYRTLIAEDRRGAVGTLAVIVIDQLGHMGQRIALVENVIVRADARGEGVGRAMLAEAGRMAREEGAYKLILATGMKRGDAHGFYETLGFERYGYSYGLPLKEALS